MYYGTALTTVLMSKIPEAFGLRSPEAGTKFYLLKVAVKQHGAAARELKNEHGEDLGAVVILERSRLLYDRVP